MAEQEITKHTKKILQVSTDSSKNWKEKLVEIIIEIFIIVFAVTLSLYLHERAQKNEELHLQNEFLLGLKEDLQNDIKELSGDSTSYVKGVNGFRYFRRLAVDPSTSEDSISFYFSTLMNANILLPNDSRFQGLKSAGKLYVIRNKKLLNDILDLYQEKIPGLLLVTKLFSDVTNNRMVPYLESKLVFTSMTVNNLKTLLRESSQLRNYLMYDGTMLSIIDRYHQVLEQSRLLIAEISKEVDE